MITGVNTAFLPDTISTIGAAVYEPASSILTDSTTVPDNTAVALYGSVLIST